MMRRRATVVAFVTIMTVARPSQASMFGEENAHLATLVGLQIKELGDVAAMLANLQYILQGVNELAAGMRQGYRVYQIIRNYSLEDLKRDAKRGLMEAFPELRGIDREVGLLIKNHQAIEDGKFFVHIDRHDSRMHNALSASYRYAFRSSLWPIVYPEAKDLGDKPSEVDLLVQRRLQRAGLRARTAVQNTALGILAKKAATLVQDAEDKGRSDQASAALAAQAAVQNTANTTKISDLAELEAAREESSDMQVQAFEAMADEAMKANTAVLFEVGSIK
jgi:hypothetical protein